MADSAAQENNPKTQEVANAGSEGQEVQDAHADVGPEVFPVTVKLPKAPHEIKIIVTTQEQIQDVRQSIIDTPDTWQYSCFHLEHEGTRINDYIELSEVPGIKADSVLELKEDPYNEKEAKIHFLRIRELIGAASPRQDTTAGIENGLSLFPTIKTETSGKHPMADYQFESTPSLNTLVPPEEAPTTKTVKSISLSHWNPPPYHLRQRGHLLYLQVATLENETFHITSHVSGFYVNKSTSQKFDPTPNPKKSFHQHSLLNLLKEISPLFVKEFQTYQEQAQAKEPLVTFVPSNAIPASPWVVKPQSVSDHQPDIVRTEEAYLLTGTESVESLRDFNEEFQSTRELPKETIQERVFRERLLSKLFADYTDAAVRGAVLIARGEIAPLNPTESRDAQIFVHNNIFFSYGCDGVGTFAAEGGDEAARVATSKDVLGVRLVNTLDVQGLSTPGTVVVDYMGRRIVAQSIIPGIFRQREDGQNQIDYGGVEGRDVVATNEAFVPLFEQLSSAMRVKPHSVWDKEGKKHDLVSSVETKGLIGTDGRKYVLDLYRVTPLDIEFIEKHWKGLEGKEEDGYPHRMAVLRPELIESYWRVKMREYILKQHEEIAAKKAAEKAAKGEEEKKEEGEKTEKEEEEKKEAEEEETPRVDMSGFKFSLNPDVFSGQQPQTEEEKAQYEKDEAEVREVCKFLTEKMIPGLINDLKEGEAGLPIDGQSLTRIMHKRGINVRYLGQITTLAAEAGTRLDAIRSIATHEMISRSIKHILNPLLRNLPQPLVPYCASHFLNCILGTEVNPEPKPEKDAALDALYPDADKAYESLTPETLQQQIKKDVLRRFRYELPEDWVKQIKHIRLLREISLKLGFQLVAREYNFATPAPVENKSDSESGDKQPTANGAPKSSKKKKTKATPPVVVEKAAPSTTFTPADILNVVPIVKDASTKSQLAEEALEAGKIAIFAQQQRETGQELLLESLSLHEQIYGILHPDVARVYGALAMIYYQLDEKAAAVELGRKAVIVSERTIGVDSAETILHYLNLGLFEHANSNTNAALAYIRHAFNLWRVVYGEGHPDSVTSMNNVAVMLQAIKHYHDSRLWFEASLKVCESIYGKNSPNTATLSFQLAQALALDNDSKAAVVQMRNAYTVFSEHLGPEDRNTKEAETWLEQLTQNAVNIAKAAKEMQSRRRRGIPMQPRVTMTARPQAQSGIVDGPSTPRPGAVDGPDNRAIEDLVRYIEGQGQEPKAKGKKRTGRANPKRRGAKA